MKNRFEILFHQTQELMGTIFGLSYGQANVAVGFLWERH
jgi:hypothetical protein